ncbi:DUF1152 domain-containing protein [Streptomyces candidus]|uniref:DUF1152 domain-containing protein n=1 Tax=Streptomyces candidus TaxID=67283 RepID=A0A7X0LP30_9ACTN|nr:DUF1152 domain-containing protein [Streptomyces candidus]MBB6436123.1 hypothetical protein [Streptomyces candidus]GHH43700.1 hypothetical protein GCM10018773_30260 [Streptomyces candidus]
MTDLYLAAGGGGDPIGTLIAARTITVDPAPPLIATYAWERPEVDPTHRPLGERDFAGLAREAGGAPAFTPATRARLPAGSTMPGLARDLPARLLLLDPTHGLSSLSRQIASMAEAAGGRRIRIVDIGGDILTHGDEPTLCSPFGDAYTLAACHLTGIPTTVYLAGPGLDGEIGEQPLLERLAGHLPLTPGRGAASAAAPALAWHPSEASALWAAAIHGTRGTVRTARDTIHLTDVSPRLYHLPLQEALGHNPVAQALLDERPATLDAAAGLSHRLTGIHGLEPERNPTPQQDPSAANAAFRNQDEAMKTLREAARGADHITFRYAARTLGLTWTDIPALREILNTGTPLLQLT